MPTESARPLLAPQLYARSLGTECQGNETCHWCGSAATQRLLHDDLPPSIGVKNKSRAKVPSSPWSCMGCHLWRRKRVTANWFSGGQTDSTFAGNFSWLFFDQRWRKHDPGTYAINFPSFRLLYEFLLSPPKRWCLTLRADCGGWRLGQSGRFFMMPDCTAPAPENLLHIAEVNDVAEVLNETIFKFTLNNIVHEYSPYELEQGLRFGSNGREPGVRALLELMGPHELPPLETKEKKRGHPYPDTPQNVLKKKR